MSNDENEWENAPSAPRSETPGPAAGGSNARAAAAAVARSSEGVGAGTARSPGTRARAKSDTKMAILGARDSGKTYLFQAMCYRAFNPTRSGAIHYYLKNVQAEVSETTEDNEDLSLDPRTFNAKYKNWERLAGTQLATQKQYNLRLRYKTGLFSWRPSELSIDFLDGSGEAMQAELALMTPEEEAMWERAFLPARVVLFCLPIWAAFPHQSHRATLASKRERALDGFHKVVSKLKALRDRKAITHPVQSILVLTMADDSHAAFPSLRAEWIAPHLDAEHAARRSEELRSGRGLMRYLTTARHISDVLHKEFESSHENDVQRIPTSLQLDGHLPMIVAVSAIDGAKLDLRSPPPPSVSGVKTPLPPEVTTPRRPLPTLSFEVGDPVPAHVELPLLLALCEQRNALM